MRFIVNFCSTFVIGFTVSTVLLHNGIRPSTWSFWLVFAGIIGAFTTGMLIGAGKI